MPRIIETDNSKVLWGSFIHSGSSGIHSLFPLESLQSLATVLPFLHRFLRSCFRFLPQLKVQLEPDLPSLPVCRFLLVAYLLLQGRSRFLLIRCSHLLLFFFFR